MFKVVNIKKDMPSVDYAIYQLDKEIGFAFATQTPVLIIIHGYGSGGTKGQIKENVNKFLSGLKAKKKIIDFIPGEAWGETNERVAEMKSLYPSLILCDQISNLNSGVTIVWVLKNKI